MAKYSASLVKEIIAELGKVPMIRQACSKLGIDHSTFYRWMLKHPDFHSKVMFALHIGRRNISDAAESVIVRGIQNNKFRHAAFFLTHNDYRYMKAKEGAYHGDLAANDLSKIEKHFADKSVPRFEDLFEMYDWVERDYDSEPELIKRWVDPFIEIYCDNDPKLVEAFHHAYEGWKKDTRALEDSMRRANIDVNENDIPFKKKDRQ